MESGPARGSVGGSVDLLPNVLTVAVLKNWSQSLRPTPQRRRLPAWRLAPGELPHSGIVTNAAGGLSTDSGYRRSTTFQASL